jgi:hypothetical protein
MPKPDITDVRLSSSAIDDFFNKPRVARSDSETKIRIASMSDLAGFQFIADDKLVRLSKKDFWRVVKDDSGGWFIERLINDEPVNT